MNTPHPLQQVFRDRRQRLCASLQDGIAILPTAAEKTRNRDAHYPYRFDSYFYYLTGFTEPEAVLVLIGGNPGQSILFCREKDELRETWEGVRHGPTRAQSRFAFDACYPISELDIRITTWLANQHSVYYALGDDAAWDTRIQLWLSRVREQVRTGIEAPTRLVDVRQVLDEMRVIKDASELDIMRRAAAISAQAHQRAMQHTRPGRYEYEIEAELLYAFRRGGAQAPAYTSIVAGGANACVLHYVSNDAVLRDGDLLLIDAGCELDGYASDITRTFPVNGVFSGAQRSLYALVLAAQDAAFQAIQPNATWNAPHDAAVRVLTQGMLDLGLLQGSLDAALETESYRRFYMHRTGHWLGLDVHDAGSYKQAGQWRALQPGMVLTVEPGIYVRAADDVPTAFHDIGIRIEDDVVITPKGHEVLTHATPKSIDDIEALMRAAR